MEDWKKEYIKLRLNTNNSENKNESLKSSNVKIKNLDKNPPKIIGNSKNKVSRKNIQIKINEKIEKDSNGQKLSLKIIKVS